MSRRSFLAGGVAVIGATAAIAIPAGLQGHFYPGATVADVNLGGKTAPAAAASLHQKFAGFEQQAVTFRHGDQTWTAGLADLGFTIDYDASLHEAFQHGRDDGVLARYTTWLEAGDSRTDFPLKFTEDPATLDDYLATLDADVTVPAQDASLVQNGTTVDVQPDVPGSALGRDAVRASVVASVRTEAAGTVTLTMEPVAARISAQALSAVRDQAAALLEGPVAIVNGSSSWSVDEQTLAGALVIPDDAATGGLPSLDPALLTSAVTEIADSLYVAPVDAIVGWQDGGPYAIERGIYGQQVQVGALASEVAAAAGREDRTATVPTVDIEPDIRSDNLDTLGLKASMASGDSSFEGSSDARATNVQVAAGHVSATLIAPGAQFSFNEALGPISTDNGYVEGKIIKGAWYASDLGGGVCQVSTTVYRAALKAGMSFDEWHPHTFRVSFYELDGWSPGIDAAIYQPNTPDEWELDLKFTNPTENWMLLQMEQDTEHITAQLYGVPLGYDVELPDPTISPPIAPPDPIERPSTDLPEGQKKESQAEAPGYTVTLTRNFRQDGQIVNQDTFVSDYQPQAEVIDVGVGPDGEIDSGDDSTPAAGT